MSAEDQSADPETQRFARARENSLLLKWSKGGRLSETEFEEVRHRLPANAKLDKANASVDISGRVRYLKDLSAYVAIYGKKVRTLKGWIAAGKAAEPPELPPLDQSDQMLDWWTRVKKQRAPAKIVELAEKKSSVDTSSRIDINALEGEAGDAVKQARAYLAATDKQLKEAYASGQDASIEKCQRRWLKALEALRRAEAAEREDRKAKGDLIPKAELLPELSQLLEVLRHMRSTRRRRTLARIDFDFLFQRCNKESAAELIGDAVDRELENEDGVLRRLKQFRSLEEIDAFQLEHAGE